MMSQKQFTQGTWQYPSVHDRYEIRDTRLEGPCSHGASWAVRGSGVPPYDFLNLHGVFNSRFCARNG